MNKLKNQVLSLLSSFKKELFVMDCIGYINSNDSIFYNDPTPFDIENQLKVLLRRQKSSSKMEVAGLSELIINLQKSNMQYLRILKISTELGMYSLYCSVDWKFLFGITYGKKLNKTFCLSLEQEYLKRDLEIIRWKFDL